MAEVKSRYVGMSDGYTRLYLDDQTIVSEHRYLMEQKLGRKLSSHEIVHHRDGNRGNNSIDNLELTTRSEHPAKHADGPEMVELVCVACGEKFSRRVKHVNPGLKKGRKHFFCSRKCIGSTVGCGRTLDQLVEHGPKSTLVELVCPSCGVSFERRGSDFRAKVKAGQKNFYCSRECLYRSQVKDVQS